MEGSACDGRKPLVTGDLLLTWMSEIGCGSIGQVRLAAESLLRGRGHMRASLDRQIGRWLRQLSALGHCEVDWRAGTWAVAPAAVATLPFAGGIAVLSGSRRARLHSALESADVFRETIARANQDGEIAAPKTIVLPFASMREIEEIARDIGAAFAGCAASQIADRLTPAHPSQKAAPPAYDSPLARLAELRPRIYQPVSPRSATFDDGVYRHEVNGRRRYLWHHSGDWYACELSSGIYAWLAERRESVIRWRADSNRAATGTGTVFVDWGAPPPALHERALTLCSGLPARSGTHAQTTIYENVPRRVAERVSASLGQRLQIED